MTEEVMITCPKCGQENDSSAMSCSQCRINLQWAVENLAEEGQSREAEAAARQAPAPASVMSAVAIVVGGLCTITGFLLRQDHMFYLFGNPAIGLGLIMLVSGGLGLGYSLGRLGVARGILPRRLLPLFVGVPVVLLGLLVALCMMAPVSASHLRVQHKMGRDTFTEANLSEFDLHEANLNRADLSGANLLESSVTGEQLSWAATLQGATLPDGSVHE